VAVYRPSTAQWFIDSPTGAYSVQFGAPGLDIPMPGDYDGDGRTDLVTYRPSVGVWSILRSSLGPVAAQFGAPMEDIPVPGDYDGLGRSEIAVYRPATAQWLIGDPGSPRSVQFGMGGASLALYDWSQGSIVSAGGQTLRVAAAGAKDEGSTAPAAPMRRRRRTDGRGPPPRGFASRRPSGRSSGITSRLSEVAWRGDRPLEDSEPVPCTHSS
jgi:hypothetical protein